MSAQSAETSVTPKQVELPFAVVQGVAITALPKDLYIPPDALEVFLETFEGPLDFLLYLIRRQNLDILDIPIAEITRQYVVYIDLMKDMRLELAAEYLVMAAMLAEIKSRMMLPRQAEDSGEEEDPRAELIRRLQEYERYKKAADDIDGLPRVGRDTFEVYAELDYEPSEKLVATVAWHELLFALREVFKRADMFSHHHVRLEPLSVRERMSRVLSSINSETFTEFTALFTLEEGRMGVVVTLLAILELVKESLLELIQTEPFGPIYVKAPARIHGPTDA